MLADVRQATIRPVIEATVAQGSLVHTDEYGVYGRLEDWGYGHKTVCHARGEYARDDDGDGFCEVHVNTAEGLWSLLRSWLRPHRGISQEKLPAYLGFFQVVHNARCRGKALLGTLVARANRGLAGTLVSAVAEVGGGVCGRDPVERRAERPVQGVLVAHRDPAQLGLHLRPGRLDRAQVGRVGRQVAVGEAGAVQ